MVIPEWQVSEVLPFHLITRNQEREAKLVHENPLNLLIESARIEDSMSKFACNVSNNLSKGNPPRSNLFLDNACEILN